MTVALRVASTILTPAEARQRDRILAGQYFLVRTAGHGDALTCRQCGAKHSYLTLRCVERPWSGVTRGLYAYWKAMGDAGAVHWMNPEQRARFEQIAAIVGPRQPDLASAHPRTAREWVSGSRDLDRGAIALGILEPITTQKAAQLVASINTRAHRELLTMTTLDR